MYANGTGKASLPITCFAAPFVRRNIVLQDFTARNSLAHKGMASGEAGFDAGSVIIRLASLCTASFMSAREAFVTPLPFLGVSSL